MADFPWAAVIAAASGLFGAMIPTVSAYIVAERNRRFSAVEKWNEKTWERRFVAYQDFFAVLITAKWLLATIEQKLDGADGDLKALDVATELATFQKTVAESQIPLTRGVLLIDRGFDELYEARFRELIAEMDREDASDPHQWLKKIRPQFDAVVRDLERVARDHLNPKHLDRKSPIFRY